MPRTKHNESSSGERLPYLRKAAGLTQVQLAEGDPEARRHWKRFQSVATLPKPDRKTGVPWVIL